MCSPCEFVIRTMCWRVSPFMATSLSREEPPRMDPLTFSGEGLLFQAQALESVGCEPSIALPRLMIGVLQQRPYSLPCRRGSERAHEAVVAKSARNVFQGTKVVAGPVLR